MKMYSIGDFAQKVGVTPDFLKYYEKQGLLRPKTNESGYRYYDISKVSYIDECIKLKNLGYSAKEIAILLESTSYQETVMMMNKRQEEIQNQICFLQELLKYNKDMSDTLPYYDNKENWNVGIREGFYFLRQSSNFEFYENKKTYDIIKKWRKWMPLTCSTAQVDSRTEKPEIVWGLSLPQKFAESQGVPLESPIEHIPARRYLEFFDKRLLVDNHQNDDLEKVRQGMFINVQKIIDRHQFCVTGPSYFMVQTKVRENGRRYTYQKIYVPIV